MRSTARQRRGVTNQQRKQRGDEMTNLGLYKLWRSVYMYKGHGATLEMAQVVGIKHGQLMARIRQGKAETNK